MTSSVEWDATQGIPVLRVVTDYDLNQHADPNETAMFYLSVKHTVIDSKGKHGEKSIFVGVRNEVLSMLKAAIEGIELAVDNRVPQVPGANRSS